MSQNINFGKALVIVLSSSLASSAFADDGSRAIVALAAEGGTTGIGPAIWITASPALSLSAGYGALDIDETYSTDGVDYDGSAELSNPYALLRWHPFKGNFNIAAGAVFTDNQVAVVGRPGAGSTFEIGGVEFDADQVGSLQGDVEWSNSTAPYLGIGWAKKPGENGWGAYLDIGVMDSGSAQAMLTADGPLAADPTFQARLRQEEQEVNDELDEFDLYPVIKLGLMYRF